MRRITFKYDGPENVNSTSAFININKSDNVVSAKRKINKKIYVDPKKLQLYLTVNGKQLLDDNNFIPEHVSELDCKKIDENPSHVILTIHKNEFGLPKCIQVSKTDTIESILNLLSNLSVTEKLFAIFDENGTQLQANQTVTQCNLIDKSIIKVWNNSQDFIVTLNICSILDQNIKTTLTFDIRRIISEVKQDVINRLQLPRLKNLILFSELSYFDDKKRLMDYFIQNNDVIHYFELIKKEQIVRGEKFKNRKSNDLYFGHIELTRENLILIKYSKSNINIKYFKYEVTSLLLLSNASVARFITLLSMYNDNGNFYIATEYLQKGSLKSLYMRGSVPERDIIRYFIQICEALSYMHDIRVIHRNIKCSSVLLDNKNDIKLCNFHKAKYLKNITTEQLLEGVPGSITEGDNWWAAPEVLNCEPYGLKADMWSFGAAMIEILTGKHPHHPLNMTQALSKIMEKKTIKYEKSISRNLSKIIDKCIDKDPNSRLTADEAKLELQRL